MTAGDTVVGDWVFRTVCERHNFRPFVGVNVAFALDEYECPRCVAEADEEREKELFRIRNSYWGTRTGHHPECLCSAVCDPDPVDYEAWLRFCVVVYSPGYCDHNDRNPLESCHWECCQHPACREWLTDGPPF